MQDLLSSLNPRLLSTKSPQIIVHIVFENSSIPPLTLPLSQHPAFALFESLSSPPSLSFLINQCLLLVIGVSNDLQDLIFKILK